MLEPDEGKLSSPVLRGLVGAIPPDYPTRNFAPSGAWRDPNDPDEELRRWEENLDDDYPAANRRETEPRVPADEPSPEPTRLRRAASS